MAYHFRHKQEGLFFVLPWLVLMLFFVQASSVSAVEDVAPPALGRLSMTLTPPIFQLSLAPGAKWSSNLRFVNNNPYGLVAHALVQNFRASGESGVALYAPSGTSSANTHELASWVTVLEPSKFVASGKTAEIPFEIRVPVDAEPGGHYAAILVGTVPPPGEHVVGMSVSAQISSLILVRITGDVIESGVIRDFFAEHIFAQSQETDFTLRFENMGNVHVVPEGNIVISNMFGRERGRIVINEKNTFGNVLPQTTRKFTFAWKGERNFFDIGRYSAVATLTYGEDGRKNVYRTAHFWVIPIVPFVAIFGGFSLFFYLLRRGVRRYVARAIVLERERLGVTSAVDSDRNNARDLTGDNVGHAADDPKVTLAMLRRPLVLGATDRSLYNREKNSMNGEHAKKRDQDDRRERTHIYRERFKAYRLFAGILLAFTCSFLLIGWYFYEVFQDERSFQMTVKRDGMSNQSY